MAEVAAAVDRLAEARLRGDRLIILDARLNLAQCYLNEGYQLQAQKHLEIVSRENAYWRCEASKLMKNTISTGLRVFRFFQKKMDQAQLRATFLLAAANALTEDAPTLSRSLGRTLVKSGAKKFARNRICLKCGALSIPGVTLKMQSQPKKKVRKECLICGDVT